MKYEVIINGKYSVKVRANSMDEAYTKVSNMKYWRYEIVEATVTPCGMYYKFKLWLFRLLRIDREVN